MKSLTCSAALKRDHACITLRVNKGARSDRSTIIMTRFMGIMQIE